MGTPLVVADAAAPALLVISADGAAVTLTYSEALDVGSEPATSAFSVTVNGNTRGVNGVAVAGRTVTLTLASADYIGGYDNGELHQFLQTQRRPRIQDSSGTPRPPSVATHCLRHPRAPTTPRWTGSRSGLARNRQRLW